MYGTRPTTSRRTTRASPYSRLVDQASTMANLNALANSGQLSWLTSPTGLHTGLMDDPSYGVRTSRYRRNGAGGVGGLAIPQNLAGVVSGASPFTNPLAGILGMGGAVMGTKEVKDDDKIPLAVYHLSDAVREMIEDKDKYTIVKDGKIDPEKIISKKTADKLWSAEGHAAARKSKPIKDQILAFSDNLATDQYAEALSPNYGTISVDVPVPGTFPSPTHYVSAMKIASLSQAPMGMNALTPCDDARSAMAALALQPHASIAKQAAKACDSKIAEGGWYKLESARGRMFVHLWIGLWAKYLQNPRYAAILVGTEGKILKYDVSDDIMGSDNGNGFDIVGCMLMILRSIIVAGWFSYYGGRVNSVGVFDQWAKPVLDEVYAYRDDALDDRYAYVASDAAPPAPSDD
jgi:hypothetical protein